MLTLTLAQMRRSAGRLVAAGIAIVIGTAFVAATLLATGIMSRTTYDAMAASYADADFVVTGAPTDEQDLAAVDDLPGVAATHGVLEGYRQFEAGGHVAYLPWNPVPSDPRLQAQELTEGRLPAPGEVALPVPAAERLELEVGDTVTAVASSWQPTESEDPTGGPAADALPGQGEGEWVERREDLRLSGIVSDPAGAFAASDGAAVIAPDDARRWYALETGDAPLEYQDLLVVLEPGQDPDAARAAIGDAVGADDSGLVVRTRDEHAAVLAERLSGQANLLASVVLAFGAIALIVASLVIANTFSVLVAERTRSLALLRCVGASTRQIRRSVTLEGLLLGTGASLVGIAVGIGLAQVALTVLNQRSHGVPLPEAVSVGPAVVVAPLVAGVVVTLVAAMAPARAAGRVSPLAALRPAATPSLHERSSRPRLVFSGLLVIGGFVLLGLGMLATSYAGPLLGLGVGVFGGLLSFVGVLVGAVFWIPRMIGAAGRGLTRLAGPASKLAAANTVRNPRRTAATSSALLIGVTLVAMMSTGAATARQSFENELDRQYPVDVAIMAPTQGPASEGTAAIRPSRTAEVAAIDGVAHVAELVGAPLLISTDGTELAAEGAAANRQDLAAVLHAPEIVDRLETGTVLVPTALADRSAITDGDTVTLATTAAADAGGASSVEVTAAVTDLAGPSLLLTSETLADVAPDAAVSSLWIRLGDDAAVPTVAAEIQELFSDASVQIVGAAVERAMYERTIDTLLAVVVALLGVAVIIALVGVANTLSLSVFERRRESATLRAIGLTRRQLRQTLAIEGVLIAGSGAVLGAALGTLYGWVGARTLLADLAEGVPLAVPWRDLGLVLFVALVAGFAASVLPGRRAARTSPVASLSAE